MSFQEAYMGLLKKLPGVSDPLQRLNFRTKLKWTGFVLLLYFVMAQIQVWGTSGAGSEYLRTIEILFGSSFGSLMSLGIGPIVTASILLQLLVGSKVIPIDIRSENGRVIFQGTQKLLAIFLCFVEGYIYVLFGAVPAASSFAVPFVALQLAIGGILVIFMDELVSKWGFGSGVGLFIVAGVAKGMMIGMFNPLSIDPETGNAVLPGPESPPAGKIPLAVTLLGEGLPLDAFTAMLPVIATVLVFFLVIYMQAIKIEIPLAFGTIRGFGRRWPLKFFYTSNIPVILVAALLANVRIIGKILSDRGIEFVGTFDSNGQVTSGLLYYLTVPSQASVQGYLISIGVFVLIGAFAVYLLKRGGIRLALLFGVLGGFMWFALASLTGVTGLSYVDSADLIRLFTYSVFMMGGAILFSVFWVSTSGMDAKSVAEQIQSTGMQIPGYRSDIRIIEKVLNRYIPVLAVLGGAAIGLLAAFADFTGAIGTGTGILLAVMITYQLYEEIAVQHMEDMHPMLRKFISR